MTSSARRRLGRFLPPPLKRLAGTLLRAYYNVGNCIFCKIVDGTTEAEIIFRDEQVTAFRDIHPAARVHILVIPNQHITSLNDITPENETMLGHMLTIVKQIANQQGIAKDGYRLVINTGPYAGQVVMHLHMHILAGGHLNHPMG